MFVIFVRLRLMLFVRMVVRSVSLLLVVWLLCKWVKVFENFVWVLILSKRLVMWIVGRWFFIFSFSDLVIFGNIVLCGVMLNFILVSFILLSLLVVVRCERLVSLLFSIWCCWWRYVLILVLIVIGSGFFLCISLNVGVGMRKFLKDWKCLVFFI